MDKREREGERGESEEKRKRERESEKMPTMKKINKSVNKNLSFVWFLILVRDWKMERREGERKEEK